MSLRMTEDMWAYFARIDQSTIKGISFLEIDKYYACLMIGLRAAQIAPDPKYRASFLAAGAKFPDAYSDHDTYLLGLLVEAEIRRRKLDPNNRDLIEAETVRLLDPQSPLGLSDQGVDLMNKYAAKGFELLREKMGPPRAIETFLVTYAEIFWRPASPDLSQPA